MLKNAFKIIWILGIFGGLSLINASENMAKNTNEVKNMRILVLGASGSLGEYVINALNKNGVNLRLFSRNASKLERYKAQNIEIFEGDARNLADLKNALKGVDAVYAGLAGELEIMAKTLIQAMNEVGVKRLVWITSYGIYGEAGRSFSPPKSYVESAKIIEDSTLDYTIIRPGWFSSENEINYEVTYKGEAFKNPEARISRKSIADLVRRCIFEDFGIRQSLGINPK